MRSHLPRFRNGTNQQSVPASQAFVTLNTEMRLCFSDVTEIACVRSEKSSRYGGKIEAEPPLRRATMKGYPALSLGENFFRRLTEANINETFW
jgi:hypothetical protein